MSKAADALQTEQSRLDEPSLYVNRELSLIAFQRRVLEEAADPANALLERVKFLSIFASNLDEFFMVRVAGLMQKVENASQELSPDGRTPLAQLEAIRHEVNELLPEAYDLFTNGLLPALSRNGIRLLDYDELTGDEKSRMESYFLRTVFPVLTPLAFDPGRPFPHISNLSLNVAVSVKSADGREHFARVKVPDTLAQLVPIRERTGESSFLWLEQLIIANLRYLFPGLTIVDAHPFHVTRDAEVAIKEVESDDLLETIEEAVWQRRFRDVVRLQVNLRMPAHIADILLTNLEVDNTDVYRVDGPLDLSRLRHLSVDRPDLKDKPFAPCTAPALADKAGADLFTTIRQGDVLLHHPYESFQPVVEFLRKAAADPDVLAIKMTLYRTGRNSPIVEALLEAIDNGKQVAVLVELKARFDEESNIEWARALERDGVHVVYGLVGLKVHSKVALVVRREGDVMRRYVHLATGNYNTTTARLYTDLGMLTCNDQIGADVTDLFNFLTGYSAKTQFDRLLVAPINLRKRFEELVEREIAHQRQGGQGHLILKMNALEDPLMIRQLYRASQAGVKLDLLVRGICCLRPGVSGVSDNVQVTSILGRFLEHSRIYYFRNGGKEEIYLGSADLMPRNLNRRVEVLFPVGDERLVRRLRDHILSTYLSDNVKARRMHSDGAYTRVVPAPGEPAINAQAAFLAHYNGLTAATNPERQ
ncbi:MAG TPA: polyphosphate kinase 1 [Bryobacteraceae bacterium]|nr:polyphosphate kinase 1 [Bryobacteraceae bacterium]